MTDALAQKLNHGVRGHRRIHFESRVPFGPGLELSRYRLGNGLRVYVLPDASAPVISYQTWFRVGSRDEEPGKTGLAHMFEHLMFFGTRAHPTGDFDKLLEAQGAENNASTWTDWTQYHENLPKSALPLAIALESDRMSNLQLEPAEWAREREVVRNERSQSVDDDPYGAASEQLWALAFAKHPYGWPTIGWARDIAEYTREDCLRFYRRWYAPNNATLVVVGDVSEADVLERVRDAYGGLRPATIERRETPAAQRLLKTRRKALTKPTPTAKLLMGYRAPGMLDPDNTILGVLRELLTGGLSGRLTRAMTRESELASMVYASAAPFRDGTLFEIFADLREGVSVETAEARVERELLRLAHEPVTKAELDKVRHQAELSFLTSMETAAGKAEQIGFYDAVLGDPSEVFVRADAYRTMRPEDVQRVAQQLFDGRARVVVEVRPAAKPEAGTKARPKRTRAAARATDRAGRGELA
ncbi:MAG: insulinase family protein [Sandaracinaceae bacterium]|nr:insulinase family protein [Sandaracinaceae bacterium]MBK7152973.1 insulinase family protein [Sandaracinaceae bacterium]MBK8411108.1 insulinase family protein [Sandaracinaceae bacterium]MBK8588945.1 insulinase family protein [Sandaracinaceae bacterium]